jgi:hypothetical protein
VFAFQAPCSELGPRSWCIKARTSCLGSASSQLLLPLALVHLLLSSCSFTPPSASVATTLCPLRPVLSTSSSSPVKLFLAASASRTSSTAVSLPWYVRNCSKRCDGTDYSLYSLLSSAKLPQAAWLLRVLRTASGSARPPSSICSTLLPLSFGLRCPSSFLGCVRLNLYLRSQLNISGSSRFLFLTRCLSRATVSSLSSVTVSLPLKPLRPFFKTSS